MLSAEALNYRFELAFPAYERKIRTFSRVHFKSVPGFGVDDLESEVYEVLLAVCEGYDPDSGATFNTYFWQSALNRLKDLKKAAFRQKRAVNMNTVSLDEDSVRYVVESMNESPSVEEEFFARITVTERFDSGKRQK